jgi:hypothetical protein
MSLTKMSSALLTYASRLTADMLKTTYLLATSPAGHEDYGQTA